MRLILYFRVPVTDTLPKQAGIRDWHAWIGGSMHDGDFLCGLEYWAADQGLGLCSNAAATERSDGCGQKMR